MRKLISLALVLGLIYGGPIKSPLKTSVESAEFKATTSTVFGLLGMSPATINTFGTLKEIKVDWFYKDKKIADNIAIEVSPVWLLGFRKVSYAQYASLPYIVRKLGDTTLSLGNKKDGTNYSFGVAFNFNLYNQADPATDMELRAQINQVTIVQDRALLRQSMKLEIKKEMTSDPEKRAALQDQIDELDAEIESLSDQERARIDSIVTQYKRDNWNKVFVNTGAGYLFDYYLSDNYSQFASRKHDGAFWLHWGFPAGRHALVSMLHRYYLSQLLGNGINIRLGNDAEKNVFTEFLAYNSFRSQESTWYGINFGGSLKVKKHYVSVGFRFKFDNTFKLSELIPMYNFNLGF